jgi:hypothetical protein
VSVRARLVMCSGLNPSVTGLPTNDW